MKIIGIVVVYGLVGIGCAIANTFRNEFSFGDTLLLLFVWPLYGPFVLSGTPPETTERRGDTRKSGSPSTREDDLLVALRNAADTPLASLLPDVETGRRLARRLREATIRVEEIERLLEKEEFSRAHIEERKQHYEDRGDARSAEMVGQRLKLIRRLRLMRDRFSREIDQIQELVCQLQVQAEVVRIAGDAGSDTRDLIHELVSRIHGLEEVLDDAELGVAG